ncbi:MAG: SIR2 family protein, partial [Candidatus Cloacimonetes bacterium]|nr:SIR2 family protein [Candidatus Cloacimonadota bacterium]
MRFYENGIDIPDELLYAHDEGKVVFICGSGVSKAKAKLPDFKKLCTDVVNRLGEPQGTLIRKRLKRKEVAFDRIFGMLERDYPLPIVEEFVAKSLKPKTDDLSAHRTIMKLAKAGTKDFRIITTNFDTLFEKTEMIDNNEVYVYPHLPNLDRSGELNGLVYLHGRVNDDYSGSDDGGFILTSSSFGRAYLADGWAKDFLTKVISEYTIVFIGYQADDPPVYYLLEALHDTKRDMYAFCDGNEYDSIAEWDARGVTPVKFENSDFSFYHLWKTLSLWAERASNKREWINGVMKLAEKDPKGLNPWQRTQVVHLVSKCVGMREFCEHSPSPHPEWLCVFDPRIRYGQPGRLDLFDHESEVVDPFKKYCLDSDEKLLNVQKIDTGSDDEEDFKAQSNNNPFSTNKLHEMAFNCFKANEFDEFSLTENDDEYNILTLNSTIIPQRIKTLFHWISNQIHKPQVLWWLSHYDTINPELKSYIKTSINFRNDKFEKYLKVQWLYWLDSLRHSEKKKAEASYELSRRIQRGECSAITVKELNEYLEPYLKINHVFKSIIPVFTEKSPNVFDISFEYPTKFSIRDLPDEIIEHVLIGLHY